MRLGLLVFALAACSTSVSASPGPAWPKVTAREVDGGESLAPRAAARAIAALVEDDRPADKLATERSASPASVAPTGAADKPAAAAAGAVSTDDPITTEEIVIEIED
jgi:hypothetical protein